tara:strand:- start:627 stop:1118 length:492 start_codon:yes stop_codon:yes gene_type:complete
MASTITAGTLKVTLSEQIILNGRDQGSKNTLSISNIKNVVKTIVTISTTETGLLGWGANPYDNAGKSYVAGQFDEDNTKYIRITNLDDTNHVTLIFRNEGNDEFAVLLDRGQSFIYNGDLDGGVVDTMDADSGAVTPTIADLVDVTAQANTASCDLEVFVAGV